MPTHLSGPAISSVHKSRPAVPYKCTFAILLLVAVCQLSMAEGMSRVETANHTNGFQTSPCSPVSSLPCGQIQVSLPFNLNFSGTEAGLANTGFRMALAPSAIPATSTNPVPGLNTSRISFQGGYLRIATTSGISHLTQNNQINALGVKFPTTQKFTIETTLINPNTGPAYQQAGLWFGLSDKTYVKLVVVNSKIEMRREINDVTGSATTATNPDVRQTGTLSNVSTQTLRLRLVVDPAANTIEGFYSTNGSTYINVGQGYTPASLSLAGLGLTSSTAYGGILATHRNSSTALVYSFDNFSIKPAATDLPPKFSSGTFTFTIADNLALGSSIGTVKATDPDGDAVTHLIKSGNTNGAFAINTVSGNITLAKRLNYHTQARYQLTVEAKANQKTASAQVVINVRSGSTASAFTAVNWTTAAAQPYVVSEAQGKVVNGKLYSFGGFDYTKTTFTPTSRSYVYDPVANKWTSIANLPYTPNGIGADGKTYGGVTHAGITTDGTDIYFAGGYTSNTTGNGQIFGTNQVWKYNVASNTYTKLPNLPVAISAGQLEYLSGRLHHIAGTNTSRTMDLGTHYVLDLGNLAAGWKTLTDLPNPRQHAGSAVFEGKIYYIGGQHAHDGKLTTQKDVHRYDPATNVWTKVADLPAPGTYGRGHISSSAVVQGNRILVLGGETMHGTKTNMVSAYTPATNTWQNLTPLPADRHSGVAGVLYGNIYYAGGSRTSTTYKGVPQSTTQTAASAIHASPGIIEEPAPTAFSMNLYPNPTDGKIHLTLEGIKTSAIKGVSISNTLGIISGQQAYRILDDSSIEIDISHFKAGVYLVKLQTADSFQLIRLVKQ
jgi:N-acetylneuraminic acid mutarotase